MSTPTPDKPLNARAPSPESDKSAVSLTDAEVICGFMEPRPTETDGWSRVDITPSALGWWEFDGDDDCWLAIALDLDALHEVEARLTDAQWYKYGALIGGDHVTFWALRDCLHAAAEQKIRALVTVLHLRVPKEDNQ